MGSRPLYQVFLIKSIDCEQLIEDDYICTYIKFFDLEGRKEFSYMFVDNVLLVTQTSVSLFTYVDVIDKWSCDVTTQGMIIFDEYTLPDWVYKAYNSHYHPLNGCTCEYNSQSD